MSCECDITVYLDGVRCNSNASYMMYRKLDRGWRKNILFTAPNCIRDFCALGSSVVNLFEPDTQCRNNRSGLLCGKCADGYSRVLGGTECELCTNNDDVALIVLFGAFGIILFVVLALFNMTIIDGFVNGLQISLVFTYQHFFPLLNSLKSEVHYLSFDFHLESKL